METIKEIYQQLYICNFTDDKGHPINNNIAFIKLKELAALNYQPKFHLNQKVFFEDKEYYINGISVRSQSYPNTEVEYDLSKEWQRQATSNKAYLYGIHQNSLESPDEYKKRKLKEAEKFIKENK